MFKRRGTVLIALSLALGVFAAWMANEWVSNRLTASKQDVEPVVVAALEIPYGTKIESRHLKTIEMPVGTRPDNTFATFEEIEGNVATETISRNEMIVTSRLARHESGSTLAALVSKNMRAVTVRVDDVVGVAGFLLPGNRVDVLATRLDRKTRRASAETVLRNLKVLAVDQTAATDKNEPVIVRAVTLEMTGGQSETLAKERSS
jgi:pilus assembly protein CpaB